MLSSNSSADGTRYERRGENKVKCTNQQTGKYGRKPKCDSLQLKSLVDHYRKVHREHCQNLSVSIQRAYDSKEQIWDEQCDCKTTAPSFVLTLDLKSKFFQLHITSRCNLHHGLRALWIATTPMRVLNHPFSRLVVGVEVPIEIAPATRIHVCCPRGLSDELLTNRPDRVNGILLRRDSIQNIGIRQILQINDHRIGICVIFFDECL